MHVLSIPCMDINIYIMYSHYFISISVHAFLLFRIRQVTLKMCIRWLFFNQVLHGITVISGNYVAALEK